jgi:hypothetical protein
VRQVVEPARRHPGAARQRGEPVEEADRRVVRGAADLRHVQPSFGVDEHGICEGAADVDARAGSAHRRTVRTARGSPQSAS